MKFTINSNELAKMLVSASRVINTRNTLPILDNFMISAHEEIRCEYRGEDMEIGFKGAMLTEVLSSLDSDRVRVALQSKDKPAIFTPISEDDVLALLMPMMIQ